MDKLKDNTLNKVTGAGEPNGLSSGNSEVKVEESGSMFYDHSKSNISGSDPSKPWEVIDNKNDSSLYGGVVPNSGVTNRQGLA